MDYFSHDCIHRKTLFIIEQRYSNDGYAFWFKLLELLGDTEGHYLNFNEAESWEFLQAKTHLSGDTCTEILDLLAQLKAIDAELWNHRIVWCQNFVDRLKPIYDNRRVEMPTKPDIPADNPTAAKVSTGSLQKEIPKESKGSKGKRVKRDVGAKAPSPDYKTFVDKWFELYEREVGTKPRFTKKEGQQVKSLILSRIDGKKITLEKILEWLGLYFADKDYELTKKNGYTIGGFNRWLESGLAGG